MWEKLFSKKGKSQKKKKKKKKKREKKNVGKVRNRVSCVNTRGKKL
jgi:hypothetical protein